MFKNKLYVFLWIISFLLIVFYFWYYNRTYDFKRIDDNYFKVERLYNDNDKKSFDKLFNEKKLKFSREFGLEEKKIISLIQNEDTDKIEKIKWTRSMSDIYKNVSDIKFDKKKIIEISMFYNFLKDLLKETKDYSIYSDYTEILQINRYFFYNSLYYLEHNQEDKWVEYLLTNFDTSVNVFNYWWSFINISKWRVLLWLSIKELNFIIDNYKLNEENLKKIKNVLLTELDVDKVFNNSMKYEYNTLINELPENSLFFSKKDTSEILKNVFYVFSQDKKINNKESFIFSLNEAWIYDEDSYILYFKKNREWVKLVFETFSMYEGYKDKIKNGIIPIKEFVFNKLKNYE